MPLDTAVKHAEGMSPAAALLAFCPYQLRQLPQTGERTESRAEDRVARRGARR